MDPVKVLKCVVATMFSAVIFAVMVCGGVALILAAILNLAGLSPIFCIMVGFVGAVHIVLGLGMIVSAWIMAKKL